MTLINSKRYSPFLKSAPWAFTARGSPTGSLTSNTQLKSTRCTRYKLQDPHRVDISFASRWVSPLSTPEHSYTSSHFETALLHAIHSFSLPSSIKLSSHSRLLRLTFWRRFRLGDNRTPRKYIRENDFEDTL